MGVASASDADTPSSFSNYGDAEGMVAPRAAENFDGHQLLSQEQDLRDQILDQVE